MLTRGIRGTVAAVKWSYFTAAAINGYTVTRDRESGRWSAAGNVVLHDAYKLTQRPLFFVVPHKRGAWRWEIFSFDFSGGRIVARLGDLSNELPNGITCPTPRR